MESQLQTVLNADIAALTMWREKLMASVDTWAEQPRMVALTADLKRLADEQGLTTSQLEQTKPHAKFLDMLQPVLQEPETLGVGILTRDGHVIATNPVPHSGHWFDSDIVAPSITQSNS